MRCYACRARFVTMATRGRGQMRAMHRHNRTGAKDPIHLIKQWNHCHNAPPHNSAPLRARGEAPSPSCVSFSLAMGRLVIAGIVYCFDVGFCKNSKLHEPKAASPPHPTQPTTQPLAVYTTPKHWSPKPNYRAPPPLTPSPKDMQPFVSGPSVQPRVTESTRHPTPGGPTFHPAEAHATAKCQRVGGGTVGAVCMALGSWRLAGGRLQARG